MSLIKVELHTSVELEIGTIMSGEIRVIESLDSEEASKALAVTAQVGRRVRTIGYVNSMPQYTSVVADQLIASMESSDLDKVELEVVEKEDQKIDGRNIYLLKVNSVDVEMSMLESSLEVNRLIEETINIDELNSFENIENQSNDTVELVQRALDELSCSSTKVVEKDSDAQETISVKRLGVGGASRVNPNKMKVVQLIKEEAIPHLTLQENKNGVINVIFNGKAAGEIEITEQEDMINISDVVSVTAVGTKPFGYYVNVSLKTSASEIAATKDVETETDKETLFVELMKPILGEIDNKDTLSAEDIAKDNNLIDHVWSLVRRVKGEEVCEVSYSQENTQHSAVTTNTINIASTNDEQPVEKMGKKITKEGAKKIMSYLALNDIPTKYINKIISSYKEYPERYLERIPDFEDKNFTPWKYTGKGPNLLKLAIVSIENGKNVRLVGGKGSGKNTLLSTLACVYQRPLFSQSANRDTDITHLFGDKTIDAVEVNGQVSQRVEFEKGLLVEAMEVGGFYEFGEGNACRPEVTMALHSVLDTRREADVNGYKLVKAHEDFSFVLTMNVDYEGCNSLNQAFRDRFTTIAFPSPMSIANILKQACPRATARDIRICDKLYSDILARVDELQTDEIVTIRGYINALDLAEDLTLKEALQMCVAHNVSDDEIIVQEILEIIDSVVA